MKKILLFLVILLGLNSAYAVNELSFIYINGSNNNNEKMKNWYENGVHKLHPLLRKKIMRNSAVKKYFSIHNDVLDIKDEPVIFFWGDKSKNDLDFVKSRLNISKAISSSGAYYARNLIAQYLHDAIWVQKTHNMFPILDELNDKVKNETESGYDVVLYGYSAGTFVTYEYLFNKLTYINLEHLFETLNADNEIMELVKNNPRKDTCISALSYKYAGIGNVSSSGHLILNQNKEKLKNNYLNIDEMTEKACAPQGKVKGVVNFASPLVLFYSDISDANYELNFYNKLMIKYILENGIFLLTVNFREDPLGYPTGRNLTMSELEEKLGIEINNPSGVVYDNSSVWSKRLFTFAHTSYWTARGTFSKAVVKSFVNGYKFQYDSKYQQKVIRRNSKKSEL